MNVQEWIRQHTERLDAWNLLTREQRAEAKKPAYFPIFFDPAFILMMKGLDERIRTIEICLNSLKKSLENGDYTG